MQKGVTDKYASGNLILKEFHELGSLAVGDCNSAVDKHILKPNKILTIFTFGHDGVPQKKEEGINYKQYNIADNKHQKISDILDDLLDQIQQARRSGGVLLHCYTGISRSPSVAIAYLMRKKQMDYDAARAFVKKQRSVVHPNDNFHRQLQGYQKLLKKRAQEERLRREREKSIGEQKEVKEEQLLKNQSSESMLISNISVVSKRSGIKGVVPKANRSISPQNKSTQTKSKQEKLQKIEQKTTQKYIKPTDQVKSVYSNKTKVK